MDPVTGLIEQVPSPSPVPLLLLLLLLLLLMLNKNQEAALAAEEAAAKQRAADLVSVMFLFLCHAQVFHVIDQV